MNLFLISLLYIRFYLVTGFSLSWKGKGKQGKEKQNWTFLEGTCSKGLQTKGVPTLKGEKGPEKVWKRSDFALTFMRRGFGGFGCPGRLALGWLGGTGGSG